jgi:hypothetical protein
MEDVQELLIPPVKERIRVLLVCRYLIRCSLSLHIGNDYILHQASARCTRRFGFLTLTNKLNVAEK